MVATSSRAEGSPRCLQQANKVGKSLVHHPQAFGNFQTTFPSSHARKSGNPWVLSAPSSSFTQCFVALVMSKLGAWGPGFGGEEHWGS